MNEVIKEQSKIFNISSSSADIMLNESKNSSGLWTIPNFIKHDENVKHIYLSVSHAEIPNSFYLINQYNNTLAIQYFNAEIIYYTIPVGNYNVNTLSTTLASLIPANFKLTYSSLTCKFTLTYFEYFIIKAIGSSINRIMGLDKETDMIAIFNSVSSKYVLEMPFVVNFLPTARLNLRSAAFQLDNYHSNDQSSDVFLSLQNNASQNQMILYENTTLLKYHVEIDNLNTFDIRITDDSNRNLDFNNSAWFLTLRIDYTYFQIPKTTNFREIIKKNNGLLLEYLQSLEED